MHSMYQNDVQQITGTQHNLRKFTWIRNLVQNINMIKQLFVCVTHFINNDNNSEAYAP